MGLGVERHVGCIDNCFILLLFLFVIAVMACAGCVSVSEKFMKQLSFGQIYNFFLKSMIPKELGDPGEVRHIWLGQEKLNCRACLHIALSLLYGPYLLSLNSCSLRAL